MNFATPASEAAVAGGETLAEKAYAQLRRDIIRGVRAPGERLRIEKLKSIYGIGPTPLREAMQRLSSEQLVVAQENRGFAVAPLDLGDFADLNLARVEIEKIALARSMAVGDSDWEARVVAADYVMRRADDLLGTAGNEPHDDWEAANSAFHNALVSACDSRWLLMTRNNLQDLCERYRRASIRTGAGLRFTGDEHRQITQAVLGRDTATACSLIDKHFNATLNTLSESHARGPSAKPALANSLA